MELKGVIYLVFLFFFEREFDLDGFSCVEKGATLINICYKVAHYTDYIDSQEQQRVGDDLRGVKISKKIIFTIRHFI